MEKEKLEVEERLYWLNRAKETQSLENHERKQEMVRRGIEVLVHLCKVNSSHSLNELITIKLNEFLNELKPSA